MAAGPPTVREEVVKISNRHGLHLRPATRFAQEALRFRADVRVGAGGEEVNGKSILMLTSLAAECGSVLRIRAEGEDADAAVEALAGLVRGRFGEEPGPGA